MQEARTAYERGDYQHATTVAGAATEPIAAALKDLEDIQKGLELLKRFPPDQYGPQTAGIVADKSLNKLPVTPMEREFLDQKNYELWTKALQYQKEQDTKKPDGK